jgi:hypothetical protein
MTGRKMRQASDRPSPESEELAGVPEIRDGDVTGVRMAF